MELKVCSNENNILITMYSIAIFLYLEGIAFEDHDTVCPCEHFSELFYLQEKSVRETFGVVEFIDGILETDGAILLQHLSELAADFSSFMS